MERNIGFIGREMADIFTREESLVVDNVMSITTWKRIKYWQNFVDLAFKMLEECATRKVLTVR